MHITPKVAPSFDGRISWFAFEDAIDDWLSITTRAPDKCAPSLKAILVGDASIYKPLLDRERLRDPNDGVDYVKNEFRPHFVKGVEAVFIFRFYQLQRFYRGSQDLQRWIGRLQVLRKRSIDAWMDTFRVDPPENPDVQQVLQAENAGLQADGLAAQQQVVQAGFQPHPIVLFFPLKKAWKDGTTGKSWRTGTTSH